jgi:hypothetical protein
MINRNKQIWLGALLGIFTSANASFAQSCNFLMPIGGSGGTTVVKRVGAPKVSPIGLALGRTNWNTDFAVNKAYNTYKLYFTAQSTEAARYPVQAYLKFSDGTNLQVVNELITPPIGSGAMFGPFAAVQGKTISQVNFKIGASADPGSTGFSYRISVQGCM